MKALNHVELRQTNGGQIPNLAMFLTSSKNPFPIGDPTPMTPVFSEPMGPKGPMLEVSAKPAGFRSATM
ncbi:MAG: hypothetical protein AAF960_04555 [Bacteroidota bacterium]